MRLLIVTQVVDEKDHYLSFFTGWLRSFAAKFESIEVICLKEGVHALPTNVRVHSLGKERGAGWLGYILGFYRYAWSLRHEYDVVLVHMNQEYILIAGILLKLLGKNIYLWRNHYAGSWLTDIAARFCTKIFYTSRFSYTARYAHAVQMPVGVDVDQFRTSDVARIPRSILFFARFAPSKRPDVFVEALTVLRERNVPFTASVVGTALPHDQEYARRVHAQASEGGLDSVLTFSEGVPYAQVPSVFSAHDIFVDLGSSGMYNKMLFEAAASGCIVLAASKDFQREMGVEYGFHEDDAQELAGRVEAVLRYTSVQRANVSVQLHAYAERNSLEALGSALVRELQ